MILRFENMVRQEVIHLEEEQRRTALNTAANASANIGQPVVVSESSRSIPETTYASSATTPVQPSMPSIENVKTVRSLREMMTNAGTGGGLM